MKNENSRKSDQAKSKKKARSAREAKRVIYGYQPPGDGSSVKKDHPPKGSALKPKK